MTPAAVVKFVCGSDEKLKLPKKVSGLPAALQISGKFVGDKALIERSVVTLAGERGLLLVGEPGTAKSMLSELLTAAISGSSHLTVQGTAGTNEEHLRYSWNYSLLLAKGPSTDALVPSPVMQAMEKGCLVRVEEITRCLPEVQDALISLLSDKKLTVPELKDDTVVFARNGFNVIATANIRDRGVSEMSAALKRRFNFETVGPISDRQLEIDLVKGQTVTRMQSNNLDMKLDDAVFDALITAFRDLRNGQTDEGWKVDRPSTVMSTAEAVAVASALGHQAAFFSTHKDPVSSMPGHLLGVVLKDDPEDRGRLLSYWDSAVKRRAESGSRLWQRLFELRTVIVES
jgi:MoxR-like ATPase